MKGGVSVLAIKKIIDSEKLMTIMDLPTEMQSGQVQVIVYPVSINETNKSVKSLRGCLKEYANPDLIPLEEGAWERHVTEKHGHP